MTEGTKVNFLCLDGSIKAGTIIKVAITGDCIVEINNPGPGNKNRWYWANPNQLEVINES